MKDSSSALALAIAPRRFPVLSNELAAVELKIREDLLRFRTCCADPRASK
jgi:hypothetical protein